MMLLVLCLCFISSTVSFNIHEELKKFEKDSQVQSDEDKCFYCEFLVGLLKIAVESNNASNSDIVGVLQVGCVFLGVIEHLHVVKTKDVDWVVCWNIAEEFQEEVLTVARRLNFNPSWLCYIALGFGAGSIPTCGEAPKNFTAWNVPIPGNKPTRAACETTERTSYIKSGPTI